MTPEQTSTYEDIEDSQLQEDTDQISEDDVKRVQDDQQKAQHIAQQIKKDKKTNAHFAQFLTFLLQHITNDKIINGIHTVFFKTTDPKTDITYIRKNINTAVIVGIFFPFYHTESEQFQIDKQYIPLREGERNLHNYLHYLKKLSQHHHDNIPIDKIAFLTFLLEIITEYGLIDTQAVASTEEKHALMRDVAQELFGTTDFIPPLEKNTHDKSN